jgi:hypothetical protein
MKSEALILTVSSTILNCCAVVLLLAVAISSVRRIKRERMVFITVLG